MADVFISYVEEDGQIAAELAAGLEAAGFAVWYYERDSNPGPPYLTQVGQAIAQARAVAVVISRDSLGSNQVTNEIVLAHESGKQFVPVLVGISHVEFQQRQPQWRLALGAATSIRVPQRGVSAVLARIVIGLRALGVEAHGVPSRTEELMQPEVPVPTQVIPQAGGGEITNSIGMKLRLIPAGQFRMGSERGDDDEKPVHEVTISKPFHLGIHPVTQAQYKAVMKANPTWHRRLLFSSWDANDPIDGVSWDDAVEFCRTLSTREGWEYRLPTEAEWEYACRAGSTTEYCFGDDEVKLGEYAWFWKNSLTASYEPMPVGLRKPNAWGIYDMHGNVWEWCSDWYGPYEGGAVSNPEGPASGVERVLRGGSWDARGHRSAFRGRLRAGGQGADVGFRVVRAAESR